MDARAQTRCPLCGSEAQERARVDGGDALWTCTSSQCGAGFLWPQPDDDALARAYAAEYYGEDGSKFRGPIERAMATFAKSFARDLARAVPDDARRVLDVGCGRGLLVRALLDASVASTERPLEVHGFERSHEATRGIDARAHVHVGARLGDAQLEAGSFGAVVWRHVLEHVRDPIEELTSSRKLLHPNGVLVVEVPHFGGAQARFGGAQWFHLDPPRHLFHFTEASLRKALERTGFVVDDVKRASWSQDPMGWVQSALHHMGRPRDAFFELLKRGGRGHLIDGVLGAALVPTAVLASAADAAFGGGGTLTMRARPTGPTGRPA